MKILIFSYKFHPDVGGIESISNMLAAYFFQQGNEVHLLTKTATHFADKFSFSVIRNPSLFTIIKQLKWADIVFENNPCFSMSYPNFFIHKPSVITLQTWLERLNGEYDTRQKFKHALLKSASKVIACSNAISETFSEAVVIPNPYDNKLFKSNNSVARTKDFIFLGRLVSDKGVDIAIKALYQLLKKFPDTVLTIVGDGEEMPALKALVKDLKIESNVIFKGILEKEALVNCLNEHKYIVVPSIWKEPFGIVALEGLACGCIPIVSDGGGLPEAAGDLGLVCVRNSVDSITSCMEKLLDNSTAYEFSSDTAKEHLQGHTIEITGERYLKLFKNVLHKR